MNLIYSRFTLLNKVVSLHSSAANGLSGQWPLRWFEIVSTSYILMGRYNHSLSLETTIMVPKNCPTGGEHVVIIFLTQLVTIIATVSIAKNTLKYSFRGL